MEDESLSFETACHVHVNSEGILEFYNTCHDKGGRFCPVAGGKSYSGGAGGSKTKEAAKKAIKEGAAEAVGAGVESGLNSILSDKDGFVKDSGGTVKRGKHGASLVDPHEGTKTIDGVKGYDNRGKPVPGTDAWLEAHGISRSVFESRPYIKYEASKTDPALAEAYAPYPQAQKFFLRTAEQEGQHGGYIMTKHPVPGSPFGPVPPQVRPNSGVNTNPANKAKRATELANAQKRLETLKKATPALLKKERQESVKQTALNLERIKKADPKSIRKEAADRVEKAESALKAAKEHGDPNVLAEAKKEVVAAKRQQLKDNNRANNWNPEKEIYDAETLHRYAQERLKRVTEDPKGALEAEIKSQGRIIERAQNRFDKTSAKYVFAPGTSSARIDMNNDKQNVKNLTEGKGRIYFAMEGAIKGDAVLTAIKKEDPTAAVVNVPSVTLWQQKNGAADELKWFAGKYGKGREIVLIPDADGVTNPNVMAQAKAMSAALRNFGAGNVIMAAPPLKKGTSKQIDHFKLPSGVDEGRKGIDDHLGAGRGTLGQLQFAKANKIPSYNLSEYTKAGGATGPKISKSAVKNTEAALGAISGIVGSQGSSRMTKKMLAQAAGLPETSAKEARDRLEKLGIISVEHIYDEKALSRGKRIRNPNVSDERVRELVRKGVIKEPRVDKLYTEVDIEEAPVITIRDPRFRIKAEDESFGTLSELPSWKQPASYKGWTSPVTGKKDSTGIAAQASGIGGPKAKKIKPPVAAAPGRRIVQSEEGAKRYGVPIGAPIPIGGAEETQGITVSMILNVEEISDLLSMSVETEDVVTDFYNRCHDKGGRFCPEPGGKGGGGGVADLPKVAQLFGPKSNWPKAEKHEVHEISQADLAKVKTYTLEHKKPVAGYSVTTKNGDKINMYDYTGRTRPDQRQDFLDSQARLHELYNLRPPRDIAIVSSLDAEETLGMGGALANAYVHPRKNTTYITERGINVNYKAERYGWHMPAAHTGNSRNYLISHEYGHHYDFDKHVKVINGRTLYQPHPYVGNPGFTRHMSEYGNTNQFEQYAEAFAEWHHSNGTTRNVAARALAETDGWYGSNAYNSKHTKVAASVDSEALSMVGFTPMNFMSFNMNQFAENNDPEDIWIVDDFENGPWIKGGENFEIQPVSQEEKDKADKILQAVLKELGINE